MKTSRQPAASSGRTLATLTHDVDLLYKSVEAIKETVEEGMKAMTAGMTKLGERVATAERNHGPTWAGISQVALIIATYTVLISSLVALYVNGALAAARNESHKEDVVAAREKGAFEARIQILEEKLAKP